MISEQDKIPTADKLIDALKKAIYDHAEIQDHTDANYDDMAAERVAAAKQALVSHIEQRTLTAAEAKHVPLMDQRRAVEPLLRTLQKS